MPESSTMAVSKEVDNSFFGQIKGAFVEGVKTITNEVLPNWASTQLGMQSRDQLDDTTFNATVAPPTINQAGPAVQAASVTKPAPFEQVLFDIGEVQVTGGSLLIMGAVFVSAIVIFKKVL